MKKCYRCKKEKELTEFSKDKSNKDQLTYDCKECRRKIHKIWYDENIDYVRKKSKEYQEYRKDYYNSPERKKHYQLKRLQREFGLSPESYEQMLLIQDNKCAICEEDEKSTRNKNLSVDHCHETNQIRGLLCSRCNRAIGLLQDDEIILQKAIDYLKKHR